MVRAMRISAMGGFFGIAAFAPAVTLTGLCGFVTDASGNWNTGWYNTYGPDGGKNAYIVNGPSVDGGFINSGNSASTNVSIDLSARGHYRLYAYFDGNEIFAGRDYWGLNLFFDGRNSEAGISAYSTYQSLGDSGAPQFYANSGTTLNLAADQDIAGAGSLLFQNGNTQIILEEYAVTKDVFSLDRVNNFSLGTSGRNDHITMIGLHVVPEPATMTALGLGALVMLRRKRKV